MHLKIVSITSHTVFLFTRGWWEIISWGREGKVFWRCWHEVLRLPGTVHPPFCPGAQPKTTDFSVSIIHFPLTWQHICLQFWRPNSGCEITRELQPFSQMGSQASTLGGLFPKSKQPLRNRDFKTALQGDPWPVDRKRMSGVGSIPRWNEETHDMRIAIDSLKQWTLGNLFLNTLCQAHSLADCHQSGFPSFTFGKFNIGKKRLYCQLSLL